jgi:molybdopterin/thiamine biosynthesis adenylyltransferase
LIWFLNDLARLERERKAIVALESQTGGWLRDVVWRLTPDDLQADADIEVKGSVFPITLKYPSAFPNCPPSVFPRGDIKTRSSFHQYGKGGELCLEWGADNWHPDITGADMLASAHSLLSLEYPAAETEQPPEVPSRDAPTLAQSLRWSKDLFVATPDLLQRLSSLPLLRAAKIIVSLTNVQTSLAVVTAVRDEGQPVWEDTGVPTIALDGLTYRGAAIHLPDSAPDVALSPDVDTLYQALKTLGTDLSVWPESERTWSFLLLFVDRKEPILIWIMTQQSGLRLNVFSTLIAKTDGDSRLAPEYSLLNHKSVCIVGCGSVGSKVTVSLARTGVNTFNVVDDDIFKIGNLVRNELEWRDIGSVKVDALTRKVSLVNPRSHVTGHKVRLNGQEASSRIAKALRAIADSDLVIDATSDPDVFNLISAVAAADGKRMIWAEVFAGGIGGMIARFVPGITPTPIMMRAIINQWCADRDAPWIGSDRGYGTTGGDDHPLIADDADVAAIAAHVARMALDTLLERSPSDYPYAVYFIGLKSEWIFSGPFDTYPVDVGAPPPAAGSKLDLTPEQVEDTAQFIAGLIEGMKREASDPG